MTKKEAVNIIVAAAEQRAKKQGIPLTLKRARAEIATMTKVEAVTFAEAIQSGRLDEFLGKGV